MSAVKADVDMKDASKEDVKKVEEPVDPFFGKILVWLGRVQEDNGVDGKGRQRKGLQAEWIINQIIQKAPKDVYALGCCAYPISLPPRLVAKTSAPMPTHNNFRTHRD